MKVYYKPVEVDDQIISDEALVGFVDQDLAFVKAILQQVVNWQKLYAIEMGEKWKYKIMWELRTLESKIDSEGGVIIVTDKAKIETKDFTPELSEKIRALLKSMY